MIARWRHLVSEWSQYAASLPTSGVVVDDRVPLGLAVEIGGFVFACEKIANSTAVRDVPRPLGFGVHVHHVASKRDDVKQPNAGTPLDSLDWMQAADFDSWQLDGVLEDAVSAVDGAWGAAVRRKGSHDHDAVVAALDAADARLQALVARMSDRMLSAA